MSQARTGSFRLFRVAGVDVFLHWSWFLVAFFEMRYRTNHYHAPVWNVAEYLALFGLVLLHEFGHALACRQVGGSADHIVLWPLGGLAYVRPPQRPGAVLWSIAAGPLVNVVLVPITVGLTVADARLGWRAFNPDAYRFLLTLTAINGSLLAFNLLPIYPLDGGQILRSLLWFWIGPARSLRAASTIGMAAGAGLMALAVWSGQWWFVALAAFIGFGSWAGLQQARVLSGSPQGDLRLEADRLIAEATRAIALDPTCAVAFCNRGGVHVIKGDYDRAVADCTEAIRLDPHSEIPFYNRGCAYGSQGRHDLAIADFTEALRLQPTLALAHVKRGEAYSARGEYDAAVADWSAALRLRPDDAHTYGNRGEIYRRQGDHERAVADLNEAIRLNPRSYQAYNSRAIVHRMTGAYGQAIADYDEAIRLNPNFAPLYYNRAITFTRQGDFGRAVAGYLEAVQIDPRYADAYNNLAWLWATCPEESVRSGDQAVACATKACELSDWNQPHHLGTLAAACAEVGRWEEAVRWQRKALEWPDYESKQGEKARLRLGMFEEGRAYREERGVGVGRDAAVLPGSV